MKKALGVFLILTFVAWGGYRVVANINFKRNCGGYLKRAADANTVQLAQRELSTALSYIEKEGLITGYTSVIYRTPSEDVGFWHTNLKASLEELNTVSPNATQLEKSNVLLKLRQTLLDHTGGSESITVPSGISVYPNNALVAVIGVFTFAFLVVGVIVIIRDLK